MAPDRDDKSESLPGMGCIVFLAGVGIENHVDRKESQPNFLESCVTPLSRSAESHRPNCRH